MSNCDTCHGLLHGKERKEKKGKKRECSSGKCNLNWVIGEDVLSKDGNSHVGIWKRHGQGKQCKGPEVLVSLACLDDCK